VIRQAFGGFTIASEGVSTRNALPNSTCNSTAGVLADIASALAVIYPERAERIAQSITSASGV
jgi:hypothetical protein